MSGVSMTIDWIFPPVPGTAVSGTGVPGTYEQARSTLPCMAILAGGGERNSDSLESGEVRRVLIFEGSNPSRYFIRRYRDCVKFHCGRIIMADAEMDVDYFEFVPVSGEREWWLVSWYDPNMAEKCHESREGDLDEHGICDVCAVEHDVCAYCEHEKAGGAAYEIIQREQ